MRGYKPTRRTEGENFIIAIDYSMKKSEILPPNAYRIN